MLIYPVIGGEETPSMRRFTDTPMWNARLNAKMWEYYAAGNQVILSGSRDLRAFPAAYVETAEFDCLHDEGARFAERLAAAGVSVQYNETKGTMHGFDAARKSVAAVKAVNQRAAALRRAFDGQGARGAGFPAPRACEMCEISFAAKVAICGGKWYNGKERKQ